MPRILRNYLISFIIIGLFLLAAHLINRYVEQQSAPPQAPGLDAAAPGSVPSAISSGGTVSGGTVSGGTVSGGTVSGGTVSGGTVAPDPPPDGKY